MRCQRCTGLLVYESWPMDGGGILKGQKCANCGFIGFADLPIETCRFVSVDHGRCPDSPRTDSNYCPHHDGIMRRRNKEKEHGEARN